MYESTQDLPETVRMDLPAEAQDLYVEAYNEAWENFDPDRTHGDTSRSSEATRRAWAAVKREYVKDENTNTWYRRGEEPERTEGDEDEGLLDRLTDLG